MFWTQCDSLNFLNKNFIQIFVFDVFCEENAFSSPMGDLIFHLLSCGPGETFLNCEKTYGIVCPSAIFLETFFFSQRVHLHFNLS